MHPVENIRGSRSQHLAGRRIVLGVCGSIAAVKAVEVARELVRHGAEVHAVMTPAATRIVHPDALQFATGNPVVTQLTGGVEHVALLGAVPDRADLLLVAPATANTLGKMALGLDDSPVTTCATVAFGTRTPVAVAPAMHEAMMDHPVVARHCRTLIEELKVTWIEPTHDEAKAKLAEPEAIAEAVIHRLANDERRPGPLAGKRVLVISGSTAEPIDPVRILTNRSSGRTGHILATELSRLGAAVTLWQGHAMRPVPDHLLASTVPFSTHAQLLDLVRGSDLSGFDQVWMPAAINDYAPEPSAQKIASQSKAITMRLKPLSKVIETVRKRAPDATLVAFKAESDGRRLRSAARERLKRYRAQFVVANLADAFDADDTDAVLVTAAGDEHTFAGAKTHVFQAIAAMVAGQTATVQAR